MTRPVALELRCENCDEAEAFTSDDFGVAGRLKRREFKRTRQFLTRHAGHPVSERTVYAGSPEKPEKLSAAMVGKA